jgi:cation diffusion facilitator family transporter
VNPLVRSRRIAAIGAAMSGVLGAGLIVWGASVHSVAMTAGGVVAVVRGVMGVMVIAGIRLSLRHSKNFPDGLYKVENIIAAVVGVIVLVAAYEFSRLSIKHLSGTFVFTRDPKYALPFFIGFGLLAFVMGFYKRRVAAAESCPSLKADSYFSFADGAALIVIGIAMVVDIAGYHRVDAIAGLLVSCLLAVAGVYILIGALKVLLDASVDRDVLSTVQRIAEADPGVRKVIGVDGRNSGSFVFMHLEVEPVAYDMKQAEGISRELESRIKSAVPNVDRVAIEFTTYKDALNAAVTLAADSKTAHDGFESAPVIGLIQIDGGKVTGEPQLLDNPIPPDSDGRGVRLAVFLGKHSVQSLLLKGEVADADTMETLKAYGIEVVTRPAVTDLGSAMDELVKFAGTRASAEASETPVPRPATGEAS